MPLVLYATILRLDKSKFFNAAHRDINSWQGAVSFLLRRGMEYYSSFNACGSHELIWLFSDTVLP